MVNRVPMQVNPDFKKKIKELQKEIMRLKQEKPSYNALTKEIIKCPAFHLVEKQLLNIEEKINLKMDRRGK